MYVLFKRIVEKLKYRFAKKRKFKIRLQVPIRWTFDRVDCRHGLMRISFDLKLLNIEKNKWLDAFKRHAACCPEHLPPEVPTRPTARDRGFRNLKEAQRASRQSVMITNDTMYEEECIAGQLRVLVPVWETRYVTLCSNGAVQVFKVS